MGYSKMSVTVPEEVYKELKEIASKKNMKLSHLVSTAVVDMTRRLREESFVHLIDEIYSDEEVAREQLQMAKIIADNTNVKELPW